MKMKLTDRVVSRLKPPARGRLDVWDLTLPAFGIQIRATGQRSWLIAVRRPGKATTSRIKIGDPAEMSLADARARARELMRAPATLVKAEPEPSGLTADSLMEQVLAAFIQVRRSQERNRTWKATEQVLRHDLGEWMNRPLGSIGKSDVKAVLRRVRERAPATANLLFANVCRLFNWAVEEEVIETSPAAGVKPPSPKSERERTLTDPELYEIWHGCNRLGWPFGPLIQLLMLTAQREGEVASMRWSDLDLNAATWSLTGAQTKAGRAHLIPLSSEAVRILQALPRFEGCDLVFPANRTGNVRPVSGFSKVKVRLDRICGVTDWVFHDLRRTAATAMARLKVPPHVTEKILNHRAAHVAGPMGKVYQRYDYWDERRDTLELWAQTLMAVNKVVRLRAS